MKIQKLTTQHVSDARNQQLISEALTPDEQFLFDLCYSESTGEIEIRFGPKIPGKTMDLKLFLESLGKMEGKLRDWASRVKD